MKKQKKSFLWCFHRKNMEETWDDKEEEMEEMEAVEHIEQEVEAKAMEKPKKKKERSTAQKKAWEKAVAARKRNLAAKKKAPLTKLKDQPSSEKLTFLLATAIVRRGQEYNP